VYKIVCFDPHEPEVKETLFSLLPEGFSLQVAGEATLAEKVQIAKDADFILAGWSPVETEVIAGTNKVRLIQKMGAGYDKIDIAKADAMGIPVAITAGSNALAVAEQVVLLMLAVYRRLPYVDKNLRQGKWLKNKMRAEARFLSGKTVGLLGFGHIAKKVCALLTGFSTKILYYDVVRPKPAEEQELGATYCESIEKLIASVDILSIHCPLTKETRHLIDANKLRLFKPGAILINTARGAIIDEAALYQALTDGTLAAAGLDVFESEPLSLDNPLLRLENVVVTPHMGGAVMDNVANVARHSYGNMIKVINGEPLRAADIVIRGNLRVE